MLERIEKYRILEEIGQGGMSVVYRGHDDALDRDVAVKVLHRHLARDPEARERFSREAKAVARLTHHNIPEIYDYSSNNGDLNYLVTELITGAPLSNLLREGTPMLPEIGAMVVLGVAEALEHAHHHQIIHRDVKPENILIGTDGVVKLTDFGIAQIVGLESMTMTGTLVGSPAHMSPEQIEGQQQLDYRADIWALGTVLYGVSTGGALPFDAQTPHAILKRIVEGRYEDPRRINPHVNSGLASVIQRCLQVDREARYASVDELGDHLRQWLAARGLVHIDEELAQWMADRDAYQEALSERLAAAMMEIGDKELAMGRRHTALEAYGRVLTLAPDHSEALARVRVLNSGLRRRRAIRLSLWALALVAAVGAVILLWPPPAPPQVVTVLPARGLAELPVAPEPPALEAPPTDAGQVLGRLLAELAPSAERLAEPPKRVITTPGIARSPGRVKDIADLLIPVFVTVEPPAASATIDGRAVRAGSTVALTPGRHKAYISHPLFPAKEHRWVYTFNVERAPDGSPFRAHLQYRYPAASALVNCEDGQVVVDGKLRGPCGTAYPVPVLDSKPRTGRIVVKFKDGHEWDREVMFKAGAQIRLTAN